MRGQNYNEQLFTGQNISYLVFNFLQYHLIKDFVSSDIFLEEWSVSTVTNQCLIRQEQKTKVQPWSLGWCYINRHAAGSGE